MMSIGQDLSVAFGPVADEMQWWGIPVESNMSAFYGGCHLVLVHASLCMVCHPSYIHANKVIN